MRSDLRTAINTDFGLLGSKKKTVSEQNGEYNCDEYLHLFHIDLS